MRDLRSELDACPASARAGARRCCTTFGSLAGVRRATREELVSAVGTKVADAVLAYFSRQRSGRSSAVERGDEPLDLRRS